MPHGSADTAGPRRRSRSRGARIPRGRPELKEGGRPPARRIRPTFPPRGVDARSVDWDVHPLCRPAWCAMPTDAQHEMTKRAAAKQQAASNEAAFAIFRQQEIDRLRDMRAQLAQRMKKVGKWPRVHVAEAPRPRARASPPAQGVFSRPAPRCALASSPSCRTTSSPCSVCPVGTRSSRHKACGTA